MVPSVVDIQLSMPLGMNFSKVWYLLILITISVLFHHDKYECYWDVHVHGYSFWTPGLRFLKLGNFGSSIATLPGCFWP